MKSYKEYYKQFKKKEKDWILGEKEEWWKKKPFNNELDLSGDYIETVRPIDTDIKNDVSLFKNHTNVKNIEWSTLFGMLGQALIDWCVENDEMNRYAFSIKVNRIVDNPDSYVLTYDVKNCSNDGIALWEPETDERVLEKFNDCCGILCDIFAEFIHINGKDIPCDWNYFYFSLDDLEASCKYNEWIASSDGCMSLWNEDDNGNEEEFVLSM